MPAYNSEKTISQAIKSALNQSYSNIELLVVDDCSNDGTNSIIKSFAENDNRVRLIINHVNLGVAQSRHNGVINARGDWLAFLDSDDVWKLEKLEKQVAVQLESNADLIYTGSAFMDADGNLREWNLSVPIEIGYHQLLKQNLISNSSVLVKKSVFLENEAIEKDIHEDFACWIRIVRSGYKVYGINESLLVYRLSSTSKSGNKLKSAKMNWKTYRYTEVGFVASCYYMLCYMVKGFRKYKNLR